MSDQGSLFPGEGKSYKEINDDFLHNQLIKLGDMMGDGLHHEPDGKWISQEYRRISKLLMPEVFSEMRKHKRDSVDVQMAKLIQEKKCSCGGYLVQSRKGCKTAVCIKCGTKYIAKSKKK